MRNLEREHVNQSPAAAHQPRTHVKQSTSSLAHLKSPSGTRREPVNQSPERK
jgi:hypothetical protein